jgi:transcriptional regulator GlxA family with amidase domain
VKCLGFVVFPGFQVMSFAAMSVFEYANKEMGEPVYDLRLLSETGGSIRTSIGVSVTAEPFDDTNFDTLIVGGSAVIEPSTLGLIKFLQQALAGRRDLQRHVLPGRSRSARRPTRDDALVPRARVAGSLPKSEGGGR